MTKLSSNREEVM